MQENVEFGSLLTRVLDLHDELIKQKNYQMEKMAHEYGNLLLEFKQLQSNQQNPQYSLEMITVAYNLSLESPTKKIQVIRNIRERFGIGLKAAKDLVDAVSPAPIDPHF